MQQELQRLVFRGILKDILDNQSYNKTSRFAGGGMVNSNVDQDEEQNVGNQKNYMNLINEYHTREEPKYKYYSPNAPVSQGFERKLQTKVANTQNAQLGAIQQGVQQGMQQQFKDYKSPEQYTALGWKSPQDYKTLQDQYNTMQQPFNQWNRLNNDYNTEQNMLNQYYLYVNSSGKEGVGHAIDPNYYANKLSILSKYR